MSRLDFRTIVERLPLVVYVDELDERSSPVYISPQIERLLGYTQEEWLANPQLFLDRVHPEDRARVLEEIAARNRDGASVPESDYRLVARDGRVVWVRDDEIVVDGRAHGYLQEVTGHKRDSERLRLLVGILSLAADETPPDEIVAEAANSLAEVFGGDVHVTFAERRDEGGFSIRYTTDTGKPEFWDEGAWGCDYRDRLSEGKPIIVEDVADAAWLDPIRDRLRERNVASFVDVPLLRHGELRGVLWFNSSKPRAWSETDASVLVDVAGQLAVVLANARAREQRLRDERDLRRRDAILEAVSRAAQRLVAEPAWRDGVPRLLQALGEATAASRAYLFQVRRRADGSWLANQLFEWTEPGAAELANPVADDLCLEERGLGRFARLSARNEIYGGVVRTLPEEERTFFESQSVRSLVTVPVFVHGEWWGFVGFDDCVMERAWSAAETDALRTGGSLVAAAIEREHAELVLREHEQKLRAVFDTALDAIFITDDERRYVDVNPAACDYLGVARDELLGRRIDEFLPDAQLATVEEDWAGYVGGGPVIAEWQSKAADGSIRIAHASARPNFVPGLHIAFLRDVTDRKRLEAELINAQKLESLGRLAGGVAHDFNNILTGITGYASLLLERANGDEALAHDLGEIKRAAERASELTKQLLAFGRRQLFSPRPLDLNVVLADVTGLLRRLVEDQVELVVRPAPGLAAVRADPGQMEQVILNLVVNARDALPAGGRVTIETRNTDDGCVELVVADTGAGMDAATQAQIFEPFFTTREQGVGLGLASVYGIVHQSGGTVGVESSPGEGAVFTIRLPRVEEEPDAPAAADPPERRAGSETVLLVEDEDIVRELARRVLERSGYTVLACPDGATALEVAFSHDGPIDLLLTDVVMPGLRGYEVAAKVVEARPETRVLYMSGYAEEALAGPQRVTGATLIEKPFAIEALTERVREELER
ncbi:MAG TPA: PAS domain S-box protein [Gaiellaceae bacterium]|jgi:PAS domain S-box-containing protein